jgi:hypothetical protein
MEDYIDREQQAWERDEKCLHILVGNPQENRLFVKTNINATKILISTLEK